MAWAKVDDQWFAHRKIVGLSLAARGLWTTVLSWSCAQRTNHVPDHMVRFLAAGENVDPYTVELETSGLWHRNGTGWVIHDWHEYQEKTLSEKRAEAGSKGGRRSGETRNEANGKQTELASEANDEAGTRPGPSLPDPTNHVDDQFDEFWRRYPRGKAGKPGGDGPKKPALQRWQKLTDDQRKACLDAVDNYRTHVTAKDGPIAAHVTTWLNQERWEQWQTAARDGPGPPPRANLCELCDRDLTRPDHDKLCEAFR
jgi:hypothetical protein